jgi:hypothetical protein
MLALAHSLPFVMVHMHPWLGQRMVGKAVQAAGVGLLARALSPKEEAAWEVATVRLIEFFVLLARPGAARSGRRRCPERGGCWLT